MLCCAFVTSLACGPRATASDLNATFPVDVKVTFENQHNNNVPIENATVTIDGKSPTASSNGSYGFASKNWGIGFHTVTCAAANFTTFTSERVAFVHDSTLNPDGLIIYSVKLERVPVKISGHVFNSVSKKPLANVEIDANFPAGSGTSKIFTQSNGSFVFVPAPSGTWTITASASNGNVLYKKTVNVTVKPPGSPESIEITLP